MSQYICSLCHHVAERGVSHQCPPPTPQKLETGERLDEEAAIESCKRIMPKEKGYTNLHWTDGIQLFLAGIAHARAQQKPAESDVEDEEPLDQRCYRAGYKYGAEDKEKELKAKHEETIQKLLDDWKSATNKEILSAHMGWVSEFNIGQAKISALEKELRAEKEAHEETKHRMCYESETVQMALIRERDAALASKAAAEGALEKISKTLGEIKYTDGRGPEMYLASGITIPDDGKRDYHPKSVLQLHQCLDIADTALARIKEKKE